jgi:hypothetical protein
MNSPATENVAAPVATTLESRMNRSKGPNDLRSLPGAACCANAATVRHVALSAEVWTVTSSVPPTTVLVSERHASRRSPTSKPAVAGGAAPPHRAGKRF